MSRRGFSLLELVVVLAILALLLALIVPAVQSARETARNLECKSKLKQIGLAIANYESTHGVFPGAAIGQRYGGFLFTILPFLDEGALYHSVNQNWIDTDPAAHAFERRFVPKYLCPSDSVPANYAMPTSYAGNGGTGALVDGFNGFFRHQVSLFGPLHQYGPLGTKDFSDGLSNTVAVSEWLHGINPRQTGQERLRTDWETPGNSLLPGDWPDFIAECDSVPPNPRAYGWRGNSLRGVPWYGEGFYLVWYNHALPPNHPSCQAEAGTPFGVYSASSLHVGGVNSLYGDGRVAFTSSAVDRYVWKEAGSRTRCALTIPCLDLE